MKTFGEWNVFCIVIELEENYCGVWLNGTIFYRIFGNDIGDPGECVSLRDAFYILDSIIYRKKYRTNKNIFHMEYNNIFNLIDESIYRDGTDLFKYIDDSVFPSDFSIRINVQSMLETKLYCVSFDGKTKVVYQGKGSSQILGRTFCDDIVENSLNSALQYLEFIHKKELIKYENGSK